MATVEPHFFGQCLMLSLDIDECLQAAMRGDLLCAGSEVCYNSVGGYMCVCATGQYRVFSECASKLVGTT